MSAGSAAPQSGSAEPTSDGPASDEPTSDAPASERPGSQGPESSGQGQAGTAPFARAALRRASRAVARHKIISGSVAVFVAAVIAVSLATTGGGAASGPPAPAFTLTSLTSPGRQVALSQYAGKPVIVNFWASWCDPCQKETPLLATWYKQQHGKVALLGLDENDTMAKALKFTQAKGVSYPVGFDPNTIAASAYDVVALPQTFFLNARHQIVDRIYGAVTSASLAKGLRLMGAS
jgi:cytochrome c biogenesis protein CcmG/thiol:disulfide interchange protein DsbE